MLTLTTIKKVFVGKTAPQVVIRWLLETPPVTSVIIGATKVHQLEDNMGAVGWRLTEEEVRFYCHKKIVGHESFFILLTPYVFGALVMFVLDWKARVDPL